MTFIANTSKKIYSRAFYRIGWYDTTYKLGQVITEQEMGSTAIV